MLKVPAYDPFAIAVMGFGGFCSWLFLRSLFDGPVLGQLPLR